MRIENKALCKSYQGAPCIVCGKSGVGHHVKSRGSGGDDVESNLMTLCVVCHREVHDIGLTEFADKYTRVTRWLLNHGWSLIETISLGESCHKWIRR